MSAAAEAEDDGDGSPNQTMRSPPTSSASDAGPAAKLANPLDSANDRADELSVCRVEIVVDERGLAAAALAGYAKLLERSNSEDCVSRGRARLFSLKKRR
jgi:hypothetical protein